MCSSEDLGVKESDNIPPVDLQVFPRNSLGMTVYCSVWFVYGVPGAQMAASIFASLFSALNDGAATISTS